MAVVAQHREQRKTTGWSCLEWWPRQRTARTHAEARTTWVWCAHTRGHDAHLSGERPALERASLTGAQVSFAGGCQAPPEEMAFHDPETDMPGSRGALAQFAFKDSMIHGVLQFTLRIAVCCVLHRCKSQDIHRCELCFGFGFFMCCAHILARGSKGFFFFVEVSGAACSRGARADSGHHRASGGGCARGRGHTPVLLSCVGLCRAAPRAPPPHPPQGGEGGRSSGGRASTVFLF